MFIYFDFFFSIFLSFRERSLRGQRWEDKPPPHDSTSARRVVSYRHTSIARIVIFHASPHIADVNLLQRFQNTAAFRTVTPQRNVT